MSLGRESRRPDIGNPDLHRPQALSAQTLPMISDTSTNFALSHTEMLHVTERSRYNTDRCGDTNKVSGDWSSMPSGG